MIYYIIEQDDWGDECHFFYDDIRKRRSYACSNLAELIIEYTYKKTRSSSDIIWNDVCLQLPLEGATMTKACKLFPKSYPEYFI